MMTGAALLVISWSEEFWFRGVKAVIQFSMDQSSGQTQHKACGSVLHRLDQNLHWGGEATYGCAAQ